MARSVCWCLTISSKWTSTTTIDSFIAFIVISHRPLCLVHAPCTLLDDSWKRGTLENARCRNGVFSSPNDWSLDRFFFPTLARSMQLPGKPRSKESEKRMSHHHDSVYIKRKSHLLVLYNRATCIFYNFICEIHVSRMGLWLASYSRAVCVVCRCVRNCPGLRWRGRVLFDLEILQVQRWLYFSHIKAVTLFPYSA